jgi:iron complex transport system permease protein
VPRRATLTLLLLALAAAAAITTRLALASDLSFNFDPAALGIRLDRVLIAAAVGSSLALGGVFLQALLRNPLASPDLIGASAGATLAVTVSTALAASLITRASIGFWQGPAAVAGSLAMLALVYSLSRRRGTLEPISLVLIGVVASIVAGAATMLITQTLPDQGLSISRWALGGINEEAPRSIVIAVLIVAAIATAGGVALARAIDIAALPEDEARSLGVNIPRLRLILFLLAGILTAGAVVLAGPVSFVGLVCPHIVRLAAGPRTGPLVIGSALAGIALVTAADIGARLIDLGSGRLPIGIFTALLGGPVFIYLLRRATPPTL